VEAEASAAEEKKLLVKVIKEKVKLSVIQGFTILHLDVQRLLIYYRINKLP